MNSARLASSDLERCRILLADVAADQWDAARLAGAFRDKGDTVRQYQAVAEAWRLDAKLLVAVAGYLLALGAS